MSCDYQLTTPVVFIIFNRSDTTKKVFEVLRQVKPPKLFVIADGARNNRAGEAEKCAATRAVIEGIDWDCQVLKNYSEVNLGCKKRVATGLEWVFNHVEEAIILEDDCLPDPSFFRFCQECLEQYRNDKRMMMICGTNILEKWQTEIQSYYFSYYSNCWGWATWKRAWDYYDADMKLWQESQVRDRVKDVLCNNQQYSTLEITFAKVYSNQISTSWAIPWFFTRLSQSGLAITPSVNLISNIGFTPEGTNTKTSSDSRANLPLESLTFPLKEPLCVAVDREHDRIRYQKTWGRKTNIFRKILRKIKHIVIK
ncbi:MAG: glycosyltransferase family 2 protein [Spirulinaceae cyanobacterium]